MTATMEQIHVATAVHNLHTLAADLADALTAWHEASLSANATTTKRGFTPAQERQAAEQYVDAERMYMVARRMFEEARWQNPSAALAFDAEGADDVEPEPQRSDLQWI